MSDQSVESVPVNDAPVDSTEAPSSAEQGAQAPDLSRLYEQMEQMQSGLASRLEQFEQKLTPQEQEIEDLYPLDEGDDGWEEQEFQRQLDQMVESRLQEKLTPYMQQQQLKERDQEFEGLLEQYTELAEDKGLLKSVVEQAEQFAARLNPEFVNTPEFVDLMEMVYKARKADERAAQEKPAGERKEVSLEGGGGRAPSEPEEDPQDAVLAAAKRFGGI